MKPFVIAVDFDGTLVDHRYPDIGEAVPGAFDWLKSWQKLGAKLILWTMRSDSQKDGPVLTQAVELCRGFGVEFWGVNVNPTQSSWTASPKAYAQVFVDDAGFGCPLTVNPRSGGRPYVNWGLVGPQVQQMIVAHNFQNYGR